MNTLSPHKPPLWALILLISFPSVVAVFISPALPNITHALGVSANAAQMTILLFIIGYAFGQIIYAPIANRFGRKPAIYTGLGIYFLSILICFLGIHLHTFWLLLVGRTIMALGCAVGMVISFTLISDSYPPQKARSMTGFTVLAYAFMPALAVFISGWLTHLFSWIACFDFFLLWGLVILIVSMRLPETLQPGNQQPLHIIAISKQFLSGFQSWQLVLFSCIYGLMASYIYIIASAAPFIGIEHIGLTAAKYGSIILIPYLGQLLGALFAGKTSHKFNAYQIITIGYCSTTFGSLLMCACFLAGWVNTLTLIIPLVFVMFGLPIIYSAVTVMALANYQDKATGSAIMSFITMGIAFIASYLLTLLPSQHPLTMPVLFIFIAVFAIIALWDAKRRYPDH